MLRVGLTGGVGSGKSTVAAMLRELGAHVTQSDEIGRALMQPGQAVFAAIVERFGPSVVSADGTLNRPELARIAFGEGRVEELNGIVHPAVIAAQAVWAAGIAAADPAAVAVVESALIFETKHAATADDPAPWHRRFDRIVVVTAPVELRRQRYISRRPVSVREDVAATDFDRRCAMQWTDEEKAELADFVVPNTGSLDDLRARVQELYTTLRQESVSRAAGTGV